MFPAATHKERKKPRVATRTNRLQYGTAALLPPPLLPSPQGQYDPRQRGRLRATTKKLEKGRYHRRSKSWNWRSLQLGFEQISASANRSRQKCEATGSYPDFFLHKRRPAQQRLTKRLVVSYALFLVRHFLLAVARPTSSARAARRVVNGRSNRGRLQERGIA